MIFAVDKKKKLLQNIALVILGKKSWVGYFRSEKTDDQDLPKLKKGILSPVIGKDIRNISKETISDLNLLYAKDYKINHDIQIIFKGLKYLDS